MMDHTEKRRRIVSAYYELKIHKPQGKKHALIREVSEKLGYSVDQNKSNSYVMKVIRQYENA